MTPAQEDSSQGIRRAINDLLAKAEDRESAEAYRRIGQGVAIMYAELLAPGLLSQAAALHVIDTYIQAVVQSAAK